MHGGMTAPPASRLQGAWASYDANGDGVLQPAELAKLVAAVRGSFTPMRLDGRCGPRRHGGRWARRRRAMAARGLVRRAVLHLQTVGCGGQKIDGRWENNVKCAPTRIRRYVRALRRGAGGRCREMMSMGGTVGCKGFERLVQLARRREEAPALLQP